MLGKSVQGSASELKASFCQEIHCCKNSFVLKRIPEKKILHYEISCQPYLPSKKCLTEFITSKIHKTRFILRGTDFFIPAEFAFDSLSFSCVDKVHRSVFHLSLSLIKQLDYSADLSFVANKLCRRATKACEYPQIGQWFMDSEQQGCSNQQNFKTYQVFQTCAETASNCIKLYHNADSIRIQHGSAFELISQKLYEGKTQHEIGKEIAGLQILNRYDSKIYTLKSVAWNRNPQSRFTGENGVVLKFTEFYRTYCNMKIKNTRQPLLLCERSNDIEFLIPELCNPVVKLDDPCIQQSNKIVSSAKKILTALIQNDTAQTMLSEWGLTLGPDLLQVTGRILPAEGIIGGMDKLVQYSDQLGRWSISNGHSLLDPVALDHWILVFLEDDKNAAEEFFESLRSVGSELGMPVEEPLTYAIFVPVKEKLPTYQQGYITYRGIRM